MKLVQTTIIAGLSFFLSTGISFAAELDDIELTIRVVETDNIEEMHNELRLPDAVLDTASEHAISESQVEHKAENEIRDVEHEERIDEGDERNEDRGDREDEHHDADEVESHENEHENEQRILDSTQ